MTLFCGGMYAVCETYCEMSVILHSIEAIVYIYVLYIYLFSHVFYSIVSQAYPQISNIPGCIYQTNSNRYNTIYKLSFFKVLITFLYNIDLFYLKFWAVVLIFCYLNAFIHFEIFFI